jgi:hypothetical protein
MQSLFKILETAAGLAASLTQVVLGFAIDGTVRGIAAFGFRDASGNATMPQLNSEGAQVVTFDAGTSQVAPAAKVTQAALEAAGVGVREVVTFITLATDKTYTKLTANVTATRWMLFELVKIEDEAGTPSEEILGFAVLDAGQTNFKIGIDAELFSTDANADVKKLYLYASHLDNKASDVYGKFSCNELA